MASASCRGGLTGAGAITSTFSAASGLAGGGAANSLPGLTGAGAITSVILAAASGFATRGNLALNVGLSTSIGCSASNSLTFCISFSSSGNVSDS